ncbi:MAG: hypothetical protein AAGE52_30440, partial [Myxococcota bacterium]
PEAMATLVKDVLDWRARVQAIEAKKYSERIAALESKKSAYSSDKFRRWMGAVSFFCAIAIVTGLAITILLVTHSNGDQFDLPRSIVYGSSILFCLALLKLADRLTTPETLLEKIELAKASAKSGGAANTLVDRLTSLVETLAEKLGSNNG